MRERTVIDGVDAWGGTRVTVAIAQPPHAGTQEVSIRTTPAATHATPALTARLAVESARRIRDALAIAIGRIEGVEVAIPIPSCEPDGVYVPGQPWRRNRRTSP